MKWISPRVRVLEPYVGRFEAFQLGASGCDVLFGIYPGGTIIEPHRHESDSWGVITQGEMRIMINGLESRYGPGDCYHVPAGVEHAARCDTATEEIEFWFHDAKDPVAAGHGTGGARGLASSALSIVSSARARIEALVAMLVA